MKINGGQCGIFMNAVVKTLDMNVMKGFGTDYTELEDQIMQKAENTIVPFWDNYDLKIGQIVWSSGSIKPNNKSNSKKSNNNGTITYL